MLWLKWGLFGAAGVAWLAAVVVLIRRWRRVPARRLSVEMGALVLLGTGSWLMHPSIVVVPSGTAGIRLASSTPRAREAVFGRGTLPEAAHSQAVRSNRAGPRAATVVGCRPYSF